MYVDTPFIVSIELKFFSSRYSEERISTYGNAKLVLCSMLPGASVSSSLIAVYLNLCRIRMSSLLRERWTGKEGQPGEASMEESNLYFLC